MACVHPPALDDISLSMYLDNEADETVVVHLRRCPDCRERAQRLAQQQYHLKSLLYRRSCPTPEQLRDYAWDLLWAEETPAIARHLVHCPYCTHELLNYSPDHALPDDRPATQADSLLNRIRILVANLVQPIPLAPVYGLRQSPGAQRETRLYQTTGNILIKTTIHADPEHLGYKILEGVISGINSEGLQVNLWQADRLVITAVLDAGGDFKLVQLAPSTYELILNGSEVKIHIPDLPIGLDDSTSDDQATLDPYL